MILHSRLPTGSGGQVYDPKDSYFVSYFSLEEDVLFNKTNEYEKVYDCSNDIVA